MSEQLRSELLQLLGPSPIAGEWLTNEEAAAFTKYKREYLSSCSDFISGVHYTGNGKNRRWNRRWLDYWLLDRDNPQKHLKRIAEWEAKSK